MSAKCVNTMSYSSQKVSLKLIEEIKDALHDVYYGSIELIIQGGVVTQITKRKIKKTSLNLQDDSAFSLSSDPKENSSEKKKLNGKKILLDN